MNVLASDGVHAPARFPLVPRLPRLRRPPVSIVSAPLDDVQQRAVRLPAGKTLLVLGEAGHGKTTVLVRRLSVLVHAAKGALNVAVMVPSSGLATAIQSDLRQLGVDVLVTTYDEWASAQARRAFRRLPPESVEAPPSVSRLKRAPQLRKATAKLAASLPWANSNPDVNRGSPLAVSHRDLELLFGDRLLLEAVIAAHPALGERSVVDVLERTHQQHQRTAEREWSHVTDKRRLRAVDGRLLDEGTPAELAHTLDAEDYAVLFELDRERSRRMGLARAKLQQFDIIAIDEAQEFAPLELALIGESLRPGGTLVVAGDADQQTDATGEFTGWDDVMRELGQSEYERVTLDVGYRCPRAVTDVARHVLGRESFSSRSMAGPGAPTVYARFDSMRACGLAIGEAILVLHEADTRASVLLVCRAPRTAVTMHAILKTVVPLRLVWDGRFSKQGGVFITTVSEVKGLEFDIVVVLDANEETYRHGAAAARELYVAITRARHQVAFASVGNGTTLLPWPNERERVA